MSTDNITRFLDQVAADPALAEKVAATEALSMEDKAHALSAVSDEAGTPFTAAELLQLLSMISDEELSGVAGGVHFSAESAVRRRDKIAQFASDAFDKVLEYGPFLTGVGPMPKMTLRSNLTVERSK